jgi:hypothetical protein
MRQTLTTVLEVVGLLCLTGAAAIATSSLVLFLAAAGVVLIGVGIVEGRR